MSSSMSSDVCCWQFTEVGYHGRDVDQIVKDLVRVAVAAEKARHRSSAMERVRPIVEAKIVDKIVGPTADSTVRQTVLEEVRSGQMDDHLLTDVEVPTVSSSMDGDGIAKLLNFMPRTMLKRSIKVSEYRQIMLEQELNASADQKTLEKLAVKRVENHGIVVIDEIDKIAAPSRQRHGSDASDEGVQRDLLPLIEGTTVDTKHGVVSTDHILFICAGAFHAAKPDDLLPELLGRLPLRVELKALTEAELLKILTDTPTSPIRQQQALLKTYCNSGANIHNSSHTCMNLFCAARVFNSSSPKEQSAKSLELQSS